MNLNECFDIDECERNTDGCEDGCRNTEGSFECACGNGYRLSADGRTCDDVDECIEGTDDCEDAHGCKNIDGGYECHCRTGYDL